MTPAQRQQRFADVYNDVANYPTLADVAVALGFSYQTVRNTAAVMRGQRRIDLGVPELISRLAKQKEPAEEISPEQHAQVRANALSAEITSLLTRSRYPVVNPQAVMIESHVVQRYDRDLRTRVPVESTPRTWLSDTLRVTPVPDSRGRAYLFTGAQNDTPVHEGFWRNLKAYAEEIDAEIVVGPWTYETQWWSENNPTSRAYDPALSEHLCFGQMRIGENFVFCGEMNTLPTANRPVSDLTTYSRSKWAVFPHAKLELISVPSTDPALQAHQVMTTGAITRPKVIPRKAGVKSIFHAVLGATLVEFDEEGDIFCRQISAEDDGSFYDLDAYVHGGAISYGHRVKAITFADLHHAKLGETNALATFGLHPTDPFVKREGSLIETLKPHMAFIHDGHDQEYGNHHRAGDGHANFELAVRGRISVRDEIRKLGAFLRRLQDKSRKVIVVESNHDIALDRYIREGRYRDDGINVEFGLKLEAAMIAWRRKVAEKLEAGKTPPRFSLLEYAIRDIFGLYVADLAWAYDGTSYLVDGIECGHHGFRGANGAKGTVQGFARMGRKMSIGDKHSPAICDGVYVAGAMELQQGYNRGPSGWAVSHIVQYANGKRTLVTLQKGKWRAGRAILCA